MSDIVDELRERAQFNDDLESRAAAEIERLRLLLHEATKDKPYILPVDGIPRWPWEQSSG